MSDDEIAAMPYAELWAAELGAPVPGYRRPPAAEQRPELAPFRVHHGHRDSGGRFAPDPTHDQRRA